MPKQAIKKGAGVKNFNINDFKKKTLSTTTVAEKPIEFYILPQGFQEATGLPGIPKGWFSGCYGWNSTGKSTLKNSLIAAVQQQGDLPIIFETEGNFDFKYAIDCGMQATPIMGVDKETGEEVVEDYEGNFILFNNETMCDYCGDLDYSTMTRKTTKRRVAVIEDIAYIMNDFLDKQESGELPMNLVFIWDSVGSCPSWRTYTSKSTPSANLYDANAISMAFNTITNTRIPSSRSQNSPFTNTFFIVNKIWDSTMQTLGKASVKLRGGNAFSYSIRLLFEQGKIITSGVKKLEATVKGKTYKYGTVAPIAIKKNHLPTPWNVSTAGELYCVSNGILSESELPEYKKKILPKIIEQLQLDDTTGELKNITADDVEFTETEDDMS